MAEYEGSTERAAYSGGQSGDVGKGGESNDFGNWTAAELAMARQGRGAAALSGDEERGLATVVGVYRRHVVVEPPQAPHKHTRTAGVETPDGELFMLGCYHAYDGVRSEDEIVRCEGRTVSVTGMKHQSTPANEDDEGDVLAALTPYISHIRSIELIA
jgi:hypothetical protein